MVVMNKRNRACPSAELSRVPQVSLAPRSLPMRSSICVLAGAIIKVDNKTSEIAPHLCHELTNLPLSRAFRLDVPFSLLQLLLMLLDKVVNSHLVEEILHLHDITVEVEADQIHHL